MASEPSKPSKREARRPEIPGYEIEEPLGRGATGIVYRARQKAVDREVALKVLHPELGAKSRIVRRLQREARTTARLAHPNVVSAIDMGETDGCWWYAMELVDGPSLSLRLKQEGRLKEREVLRLFIPLCEALEHFHEHGVVHRDIKPANILIDRTGRARLADLGLAFVDDDDPELTKHGGTLGTPHYMSPEQAVDPRTADHRSDLWSIGATMYSAVCGRPPFAGESAAEILSGVLYARVEDPQDLEPRLSKGLSLVLRKCLTREPDKRYQTPRELLLDLERVRERRLPKVRRRGLDPVLRRDDPRRVWLVVLVLFTLFGGGGWAAWSWKRPVDDSSLNTSHAFEPYAPLEDLAERARGNPALLAQHLSELADLASGLPSEYQSRWNELDNRLRNEVRSEVLDVRKDIERQVQTAVQARNYARARELVHDELEKGVFARTGFRLAALEGERVSIRPWIEAERARLEFQIQELMDDLARSLEAWHQDLIESVEQRLADQDWRGARALLKVDDATLLGAVNFAEFRFPADRVSDVLSTVRIPMNIRLQDIGDQWLAVDIDLRRWIERRSETLGGQLERGPPFPAAAPELREAFAKELEERRLTAEKLPVDLPVQSLQTLAQSAEELTRLEDRLLEEELRADQARTMRRSRRAESDRAYEEVVALWEGARERIERVRDELGTTWREGLLQTAALRVEEARLMSGLVRRVAANIAGLDGQEIELRLGSILHTGVRVDAPENPLENGFSLAGLPQRFRVRELPLSAFERFAAFGDSNAEQLLRAVFLFYEREVVEADRLLRGIEGLSGEELAIATDLRLRITESFEAQAEVRKTREEDARFYLKRTGEEQATHSPERTLETIDLLLEEYGDVREVRDERQRLLELRGRLRNVVRRTVDARDERNAFGAAFRIDDVTFPAFDRVRLAFPFDRARVGSWSSGDWTFDGLAWNLTANTADWEAFESQVGPSLVLLEPLEIDTGSLEVAFRIEQPYETGPPQLVVLSVAGFHIGLRGSGLPGDKRGAGWLVGTEGFEKLVGRLRAGEGRAVPQLLQQGATHEIVVRATRGTGRLVLELDGHEIGKVAKTAPDPGDRRVMVRAWDPVRLLRVEVETQR